MSGLGFLTYLLGALAFGVLTVLLAAGRHRRSRRLLVFACAGHALWSGLMAWQAVAGAASSAILLAAEAGRAGVWLTFLLVVLGEGRQERIPAWVARSMHCLWLGVLGYALAQLWAGATPAAVTVEGRAAIAAGLALALAGLAVVEQVYRNANESERWALKFLCLGVGGIFAYDFFLYSDGLLFQAIDPALWHARGATQALVAPLIGIAAVRSSKWRSDLAVSRKLAFFTTTLTATGLYLAAVAMGGYYLRSYGGNWGTLAQAVFLFGAALVLLLVLFSGQVRSRLKVSLAKHLYSYKYDYRDEWLRLIRTLSAKDSADPLPERAVRAVAQPVESPIGGLWLKRDGLYVPEAGELARIHPATEPAESEFVRYLADRDWIVDVAGQRQRNALRGPRLPEWLLDMEQAWIVVPLLRDTELVGFIVLAQPRAPQRLMWEDYDLLRTMGRQVAVDLAQFESATRLAQAEQFQAYHRFAAFMVHDLKNVVAQLGLVVSNAARFKNTPGFIDDALVTVDHSAKRMTRLLDQLRRGDLSEQPRATDAAAVCRAVVSRLRSRAPVPELAEPPAAVMLWASPDGLAHVLEHIVRNAQDATSGDGVVHISVTEVDARAHIVVEDNGCGMDSRFLRERLFRPFDTTKAGRGMGIGAYEAREYARRMGGDVIVESSPGRGTRFTIALPIVAETTVGQKVPGVANEQQ